LDIGEVVFEQREPVAGLERAIKIAVYAHAGREDKAGEPYIRHPPRVMRAMDTDTERVVAVLHDVVEDSSYTLEDLEERFGTEVRDAVDCLTRRDGENYVEDFVARAAGNDIAHKIKRADIEDNLDLTGLSDLDDDDLKRLNNYHEALRQL
jgi:Guanosine polyphosphate pyrophosphohydrolases/synthetases